jgi:hypothetical protein
MLNVQKKAEQIIQELPQNAQDELLIFLDYLWYKYRRDEKAKIIKLGGLWSDIEFDVSDEEIRHLRQQVDWC